MAHGDAREGKWRGNWRIEWVASTLHTTSEHGVRSITTADAHTSAASSRLNWRPRRFKLNRPFRRKTKSAFCACAITFQTQSTKYPGCRSQWPRGLELLTCWNCGFEYHRGHGCLAYWVLCVVRQWSLTRADHSSRGVLPTVARLCVWSRNLVNEEALAHWGAVAPNKKQNILATIQISLR
jgi:hypothetical protein